MKRVLIVDDHPVFRRGLAVMLTASGYEVVAEAASGTEAIGAAARLLPDIVLMDLGLPEIKGIPATERILAENPQIKIVVITMYDDDASVTAALAAGALGYVLKDAPPEEIIAAVRAAELGASVLGSGLARHGNQAPPGDAFSEFTPRERDVMALLSKGLSNRAIATRLDVAEKTIANYVANVHLKLGVHDRHVAAALIRERQHGQ